jgi:FkbM family methyltransferase
MTMLKIFDVPDKVTAIEFCNEFLNSNKRAKFIFGRNEYAESIAKIIDVDGFIDDFTDDHQYLGKPIHKTEFVPKDALVVVVVLGRPLTAEKRLKAASLKHLDYFSFFKYSGLPIKPVTCWADFRLDFQQNRAQYDWIYKLLKDNISRKTFTSIINFRVSYDLKYMTGFEDIQSRQYFERFLNLEREGEVFVDVGGFDGQTSRQFIERCPDYSAIHFFECDKTNLNNAKYCLSQYRDIAYYEIALSDRKELLKFTSNGSCSRIDSRGQIILEADKMDNILSGPASFIKMDIEGYEVKALSGAKETIDANHPRLAVSVYHNGDDLWQIPRQVLSVRDDYMLYLRHYTEGVDETVMFFVPV